MRIAKICCLAALPVVTALLVLCGCDGLVVDPRDGTEPPVCPDCEPPPDELPTDSCEGICVGSSAMARLTRGEYLRSVTVMFGDSVTLNPETLPMDFPAGPFRTNDVADVTLLDVEGYKRAASLIADQVAGDISLDCSPATDADACGRELAGRFGPIAYRRTLTEDERAAYGELFAWSYPDDGAEGATSIVLGAMLQSPHFLYRVEHADESGEPSLLSPLAIATRLAFFLWGGPPDEELVALAEEGGLTTAEEVAAQARRMLDDPRADAVFAEFHRQWMGIEGIDRVDERLAAEMVAETERFALDVMRGDGLLSTLLTAESSVVGPRLAAHYGTSEGEVAVAGHRGILTHASVMTAHASASFTRPVHRGLFIRSRLLCQEPPPPPATALDGIDEQAAELSGTDREKLAALTETTGCINCHSFLNPPGYAFESYDPQGRFRVEDQDGTPIDTTGQLTDADDAEVSFAGADDLIDAISQSDILARCVARQWFRYSLHRVEAAADTYGIRDAHLAFTAADHDLRELIVALVQTHSFRYRLPATR